MTRECPEAQVRSIIRPTEARLPSDSEVRAKEKALSELVELRIDHSGNLFFVRKGAPKNTRLISTLDTVVVDDLYDWKRPRKRQRFLKLRADPKYKGPIIIAEGDSWFEHPLYPDLLELAGTKYAVLSLARASDTLKNMMDQDTDPPKRYSDGTLMGLVHTLIEEGTNPRPPTAVLMSGGGNDLIAQIANCVYDFHPNRPANKYINHFVFDGILASILDNYATKTKEIVANGDVVFLHSYDYPNPQENGEYIGFPLQHYRNIPGVGLMRQITNQMIDLFSDGLKKIAKNNKSIHFVDLRKTIGTDDYLNGPDQTLWSDEMHGNQKGFELLWKKFEVEIKKHAH